MSTTTTNYGLIKPDTTDPILVGQLNDNADVIDATLKSLSDALDVAKLGIKYKGEVNYYSNLPSSGNQIGDAYTVKYAGSSGTTPDGTEYVWGTVSGTNQWINFSKDSYTKAEVDALLALKVDTAGTGLSKSGTTLNHSNSTTAKTTQGFAQIAYDAQGHITGSTAATTAQANAINSGIDSTKVAQIETNKNNISKDEAALVELVDGGAKNLWDFKNALYNGKSADASYTKTDTDITVTSNGAWSCVIYRVNGLKTGQRYVWSVKISDYNVQSDTCRLRISSDGASQRPIATQNIEGNGNVYLEFVGQPELYFAYYINFNATSYQNTYKASENMICTKAEWDISQTYQPYRPSYQELYERVVALEQVNQ